jgi:16S rRNA (uracil1498-N3)-methyltransferase
MTLPRLHVPALVATDATIDLPRDAAHHVLHVLRLRLGSALRVFDGAGHEFEARLVAIGRRSASVRLERPIAPRPEAALHMILAAAPLKGDLFDLLIQKATEMGVAALWPVVTTHTQALGRSPLAGSRPARWRKVAAAAAAQCGRATVPRVEDPAPLPAVLSRPFDGLRLLLDELSAGRSLPHLVAAPPAILLLVGPAGGWSREEVRFASVEHACLPVSLGPRVLRAETAALAAIVAVQVLWGDLQPEPPPAPRPSS